MLPITNKLRNNGKDCRNGLFQESAQHIARQYRPQSFAKSLDVIFVMSAVSKGIWTASHSAFHTSFFLVYYVNGQTTKQNDARHDKKFPTCFRPQMKFADWEQVFFSDIDVIEASTLGIEQDHHVWKFNQKELVLCASAAEAGCVYIGAIRYIR